MYKILIALFTVALISSCGEAVELSGGTTNTVTVDALDEPTMKHVNGIFYVEGQILDEESKLVNVCIALDTTGTTLYPDAPVGLVEFDSYRVTPYTTEELTNCGL